MSNYYGMATYSIHRSDSLQHFGIKGQKWGIRRFQNEDGSLTPEGEKRYNKYTEKRDKQLSKARYLHDGTVAKQSALRKAEKYDQKAKEIDKSGVKRQEEQQKADEESKKYSRYKDEVDALNSATNKADKAKKLEKMLNDVNENVDKNGGRLDPKDPRFNCVLRHITAVYNANSEEANTPGTKKIAEEINAVYDRGVEAYNQAFAAARGPYKNRLRAAENDPIVKQLKKEYNDVNDKMLGQILKDLGIPDTPENRHSIIPYVFFD